jgi:hypothetical protein
MVGDLKLQLQLQEQQQVAPSKRANGDGTMVRVKTERESVDIVSAEGYDGASAVTQVGGDGTEVCSSHPNPLCPILTTDSPYQVRDSNLS